MADWIKADIAREDREMADAPIQLRQDARYEAFLHARVGEDSQGVSVTVLSMLARLDVDPWGEASDLAVLPERAARQRLEALMTQSKILQTINPDRGRTVSRLLDALPLQVNSARTPSSDILVRPDLSTLGSPVVWIIATLLFLVWVAILVQGF